MVALLPWIVVFLGEPGSPEFVLRAKHGLQATMPTGAVVRVGQGIAGVVAASGSARIVDDPRLDLDVQGQEESPSEVVSAMIIPLLDHELRVTGVMNIARTIGEPKFLESDLEQAEIMATQMALAVQNAQMVDAMSRSMDDMRHMNEKLVAVLDSVAGGVLVVDQLGQVVNQNRVAAEFSYWAAQPPDDLLALKSAIDAAIDRLPTRKSSFQERCNDPETGRTWMLVAVPLASGGGVLSVREVTEIESRERELARVKRLAEIGQMTAAIAHEIRNPLTGIRSAAQTVRQHPDLADDLLGMIDEEVAKLNQLCEDFLEFARPLHVDAKPTELGTSIQRVGQLVEGEFAKKGVILVVDVEESDQTVWMDARRMEQVIQNLLRNALQASKRGATVRIRAKGNQFFVEDQGIGIPKDQQSKLFSPFFTTTPDGTGLGLCNVRKIVDAHGGSIVVESEAERGSRFTVDLTRRVA